MGRRVLIVDGNVDAAESLSLLLQLHNHVVATAYTGPDALKVAQQFRPDQKHAENQGEDSEDQNGLVTGKNRGARSYHSKPPYMEQEDVSNCIQYGTHTARLATGLWLKYERSKDVPDSLHCDPVKRFLRQGGL